MSQPDETVFLTGKPGTYQTSFGQLFTKSGRVYTQGRYVAELEALGFAVDGKNYADQLSDAPHAKEAEATPSTEDETPATDEAPAEDASPATDEPTAEDTNEPDSTDETPAETPKRRRAARS